MSMSRFVALGTVALLSFATAVSALTFNPTQDNRSIYAGTVIFNEPPDMANDSPSVAFSEFDSQITANSLFDGFFADSLAFQFSQIGERYIQGNGFVDAQVGFRFNELQAGDQDNHLGGPGLPTNSDGVSAGSQSLLEILFSIDMDAQYDVTGFISAGTGVLQGVFEYGASQSASVVLFDIDNNVALIDESVSEGGQDVSTSGILSPGNYRFTVDASVKVSNSNVEADGGGGGGGPLDSINSASAGFEGISLFLSDRDQPIPEPVTTTLAVLGLGALALQTSRRRRA